jgi:hypothetical protein
MARKPKYATGDNTIDRWREQLRYDAAFAQEALIKQGHIVPMFVVHTRDDGPNVVIAVPWKDDSDKTVALMTVKALCVAHDAVAISQIVEAWMRAAMPGEREADYQNLPPSKAENRREIVMCTVCWRDDATGARRGIHDMREIVRRANGRPSGLAPLDRAVAGAVEPSEGSLEDRMVELLPETRPTPQERAKAREVVEMIEAMGGLSVTEMPRRQ